MITSGVSRLEVFGHPLEVGSLEEEIWAYPWQQGLHEHPTTVLYGGKTECRELHIDYHENKYVTEGCLYPRGFFNFEGEQEETEIFSLVSSLPKMPVASRIGPAQSQGPGNSIQVSHVDDSRSGIWASPAVPSVVISRMMESEIEPGPQPRHCSVESRCPKKYPNCYTRYPCRCNSTDYFCFLSSWNPDSNPSLLVQVDFFDLEKYSLGRGLRCHH